MFVTSEPILKIEILIQWLSPPKRLLMRQSMSSNGIVLDNVTNESKIKNKKKRCRPASSRRAISWVHTSLPYLVCATHAQSVRLFCPSNLFAYSVVVEKEMFFFTRTRARQNSDGACIPRGARWGQPSRCKQMKKKK